MRPLTRDPRAPRAADPAPSRLAWRFERLMLTPFVRSFLRNGVPLIVVLGGAVWWFGQESNRTMLIETASDAKARFEARPEFMVNLMAVDGADDLLAQEIRAVIPLEFPQSSFDLDLDAMRDRITALDPVETATVRIRPGGVLSIDVTPRVPAAVWRSRKGLSLVDVNGAHVTSLDRRSARPDLPLIAGVGASVHVAEALALHRAAAPLEARLRGIVRIGERRWDVVLDRGQRILLPERGAVEALERVITLDAAQDILSRDVRRVDMRLGVRPTLQMTEFAVSEWWRIRQVSGQ